MSESLAKGLEAVVTSSEPRDYAATGFHHCHSVAPEKLLTTTTVFLDAGYILETITCQDCRKDEQVMRLCYLFNSLDSVDRHLVHVDVTAEVPVDVDLKFQGPPSLSGLFGGANWFEREVYDMFGIEFSEHPNLERILLPDDSEFYPLRKDFGRIEDAEVSDD